AANPAGDTVAAIFGSFFSDIDGGRAGIAVTALTGADRGAWQFSLDDGTTWTNFGAVSARAARLLSGSDRIRFVPTAGFVGGVTLQGNAWDGSTGSDGGIANLSGKNKTGGKRAFSTTLLTAFCLINSAPELRR